MRGTAWRNMGVIVASVGILSWANAVRLPMLTLFVNKPAWLPRPLEYLDPIGRLIEVPQYPGSRASRVNVPGIGWVGGANIEVVQWRDIWPTSPQHALTWAENHMPRGWQLFESVEVGGPAGIISHGISYSPKGATNDLPSIAINAKPGPHHESYVEETIWAQRDMSRPLTSVVPKFPEQIIVERGNQNGMTAYAGAVTKAQVAQQLVEDINRLPVDLNGPTIGGCRVVDPTILKFIYSFRVARRVTVGACGSTVTVEGTKLFDAQQVVLRTLNEDLHS